jgi:hypothetical protein
LERIEKREVICAEKVEEKFKVRENREDMFEISKLYALKINLFLQIWNYL